MAIVEEVDKKLEHKVRIEDTKLIIENLVVDDRDVAEYIALVDDRVSAIAQALRIGVRVLQIAATSGDVEMVKREFDDMAGKVSTSVEQVLREAREAVAKRLAEFSTEELQKPLREHRNELDATLVKLFGPDSAHSVQKQIDEMLQIQGTSYTRALAGVLERTDDPENPFFKLRKELAEKAEEAVKEIRELRDKVIDIVGEAKGVALEREKGTAKGRTYQEYVFEQTESMARVFGDTAQYVADQEGSKGKSKVGDIVVELNPRDTGFTAVRIVLEAKNRSASVPSILSELDEAMQNRIASASVAVFSSTKYVPSGLKSWRDYPGHKYICVLDEEDPDPFTLEFSYRCARFDALKSIEIEEARLDFAAIEGRVKQVRARLNEFHNMRSKLGGATRSIEEVQTLIDKHQQAMRTDLDEIDRLLSVGQQVEAPQ